MQIRQNIIARHNNTDVIEYQLIAEDGFQVNILNYGGIINGIFIPDKSGKIENIVLKHPEFNPENPGHFGAITGRIAGRIANAEFNLAGKTYNLAANNGKHNLHGGPNGLDKQFWNVAVLENGLRLTYHSHDGESGFPGNINFVVEYLIEETYQLTIKYSAITDSPTIINLTNHSYFDLTSGSNPLRQELTLDADYFAEVDTSGIVSKVITSVKNTPFDLQNSTSIASIIKQQHPQLSIANGLDHPFILKNNKITLKDQVSKRILTIETDQAVCVVYTANHLKHSGICLETQAMPDAINWEKYRESVIYTPEKLYSSYNTWQFGLF